MKKIDYDKSALIGFIEENKIQVPILIGPFSEYVIPAELVLTKVHELSGLSLSEFQSYLNNKGGYIRDEYIDKFVSAIEHPGVFILHGYENVGNRPYVNLKKLSK